MKKDAIINGYKILNDFELSGLSKWAFAEKNGREYFIKEFLSPTYPIEGTAGSAKVKEKKLKACEAFEYQQVKLINQVKTSVSEGGNLIFTKDFFRAGAKYYKITDKIKVASISIKEISELPFDKRLLILKTVAHSLKILHQLGIVHGDLKPDNILIKSTATTHHVAKLIDFDNSYFSGEPPLEREKVVGDQVYYSPELEKYIKEDSTIQPSDLQMKSDIFALGLIYCLYLTGALPKPITEGKYACTLVNTGTKLQVMAKKDIPVKLLNLIDSMLVLKYEERPSITEVFDTLKNVHKIEPITEPKSEVPKSTGILKIGISNKSKEDSISEKPVSKIEPILETKSAPIKTTGTLKGSLRKKIEEDIIIEKPIIDDVSPVISESEKPKLTINIKKK